MLFRSYDHIGINSGGYGTTEGSTFQIAELVVYNSTLTSTQITTVEGWLDYKYGIF